jgi:hypothetical protein
MSGERRTPPARAGKPTPARSRPDPIEQVRAAGALFDAALAGFHSTSTRMSTLARAARSYATSLRAVDFAGYAIDHELTDRIPAPQRPPVGLHPASARMPAVDQWRAFDRAYEALLATVANPTRSFRTTGDAVDVVADAAEQLALALADPDAESSATVAVCSFCGTRGDQARMTFEGRDALICDRCIKRAVDALDERFGEDWRDA